MEDEASEIKTSKKVKILTNYQVYKDECVIPLMVMLPDKKQQWFTISIFKPSTNQQNIILPRNYKLEVLSSKFLLICNSETSCTNSKSLKFSFFPKK